MFITLATFLGKRIFVDVRLRLSASATLLDYLSVFKSNYYLTTTDCSYQQKIYLFSVALGLARAESC